LFATVHCNFGLGEILDPGLCVECENGHFHVQEDQFLAEICHGELVITTLNREALPLLRYQTRVAAELRHDKCACGRTGAILLPGARLDGRLRVNEEPLYECQIAEVLAHTRLAGHAFTLEITEGRVVVKVVLTEDLFADTIWFLQKLQYEVESEFKARLGIETEVRFTDPPKKPQKN
jgi:phenylacetate-CoA ligase